MSHVKVVLTALLGTCALLASVAAMAQASDSQATSARATIQTVLQADLSLKSAFTPALLSTTAFHQKTCRCSCGFPCNQDDDCGPGGRCDQFISCCNREQTRESFQRLAARSTRKGEFEATEVTVNAKCK